MDTKMFNKDKGMLVLAVAVVAVMLTCPFVVMGEADADLTSTELNPSDYEAISSPITEDYTFTNNVNQGGNYVTVKDNAVINGAGYTLFGGLSIDSGITSDDEESYTVTVTNLKLDGRNSPAYGISSTNEYGAESVRPVNLVFQNCTFENFKNKTMYLTNIQSLKIVNCTFTNNAYTTPDGGWGDYTIDVNLLDIQNSNIEISDCTFNGDCGHKSVMKITQRGYGSKTDDVNPPNSVRPASIDSVVIKGNTFNTSEMTPVDITFGSSIAADNGNKSYTSAFDAYVVANGETVVSKPTAPSTNMRVTLTSGSVFSATSTLEGTDVKTGTSSYTLESGSAVISGYIPATTSLTVAEGAYATAVDVENDGQLYSYDGNLSGTVTGNAVDNTDTVVIPPIWDDDDDYVPPVVPSQTGDSGDDDTVTVVACAAAAVVAALLAAFLILDRKH